YPDPQDGPHPDGNAWQPETVAFMNFADAHDFNMGANFHCGAEVFNYPWDTKPQLTADDSWWYHVGRGYADTIHLYGPITYFTDLNNGVTNGYAWYEVNGGRQDYMNFFHHCREVTIEISDANIPTAATLPNYWNYNNRSLLNYLEESLYGVRGLVTDSVTGAPLKTKVFISGHDFDSSYVYTSLPVGNYHRYLYTGTYNLTYSASGYYPKTFNNVSATNHTTTLLDVQLIPHPPEVHGKLTYANTNNTYLANVTVLLKDSTGTTVATTTTNSTGDYSFTNLVAGMAYTFDFTCSLPFGGVNSVDALAILKHFVNLSILTGIYRQAADVDNSGTVNSIDALMTQKRFVGLISSFPAGNWTFTRDTITLVNPLNTHNLKALCVGDVNGSYLP
ncbi:MAG: M14 family zinc carboxypeptidase, partial [Bacteroidetes bacterium]|nr:M14 family zinc carboxypeptidase [Bacteroidota bacterium]